MDQTLKPQKFKKYLMTLDTLRKTVTNILRTGMWLVTQPSSKSLMANVKSAESFNRKIKINCITFEHFDVRQDLSSSCFQNLGNVEMLRF